MSNEMETPMGESVEQTKAREKREWGGFQAACIFGAAFFRVPVLLAAAWLIATIAAAVLVWAAISNPIQSLIGSAVALRDPWCTREAYHHALGEIWLGYWIYIPFAISVIAWTWLWANRGILATRKRLAWTMFWLLPLGGPIAIAFPFFQLARFLRRRIDSNDGKEVWREECWKLFKESDDVLHTNWGDFPGWIRGGFPLQKWVYRVFESSVIVLPLLAFVLFLLLEKVNGGVKSISPQQADGLIATVEGDVSSIVSATSFMSLEFKCIAVGLFVVLLVGIADAVGWKVWRHMRDVQLPHWKENRSRLD